MRRILACCLLLLGCPDGDDDDSTPIPEPEGEPCGDDAECEDFADGLTICVDGLCAEGDRNDSRETAQLIEYDETVEHYIAPAGDVDWFRFNGGEGDLVLLSTTADDPERLDTVIEYFDSDGDPIGWNDDFDRVSTIPPDSRLYSGVPADGTYYVRIQDRRSWANDPSDPPVGGDRYDYTLTLARPGGASGVTVAGEPNDSAVLANDWEVDDYRTNYTMGGVIDEAGDADWARVPVAAGDALRLYGFPNGGGEAEPAVTVLLPDGVTEIRTYTGLGWTTESRGWIPVLEDGPYYLRIEDDAGLGGPNRWYFLHAARDEAEDGFLAEQEPNDLVANVLPGLVGGNAEEATVWGRLGTPGDVDRFSLTTAGGDRLAAWFERTDHGEVTTPRVRLFDPSGDERAAVAWTGDADQNLFSGMQLDEAGTWVIEVSDTDPLEGSGGRYWKLRVSEFP